MVDQLTQPASRGILAGSDWRKRYERRLFITDAAALVWSVYGTQLVWLGFDRSAATFGAHAEIVSAINYTLISLIIVVAWLATLSIYGSRADRVVGVGSEEYRRIFDASLRLFGLVAIVAFLIKLDLARGYILVTFPVGVAVLFASRWLWRQWLSARRANGEYTSKVVLIGSALSIVHIASELTRRPDAGYSISGAIVPGVRAGVLVGGGDIRTIGTIDDVVGTMERFDADTVVITSADELPPEKVRRISWGLEPGRQHLVVAPSLTDIGGPRIHVRPVSGLPLMHVETPNYQGRQRVTKRAFDILGSGLLLLLLSPIFLGVMVAIKLTSPGPIFYLQERVGKNGAHFGMIKFRSMIVDADAQLQKLLAEQGTSDRPLFKIKNDPRLTKIGGFIRKYSVDELPQLINVFKGDMSLIGPRPQRDAEVALYDETAARRLIVQPGMTGLWQVSGRSNLTWEEAIRLDLYYVENWSLTGDLVILWRTLRAVIAPGAEAF